MKSVAKCIAFLSLSYQVHVQICNPIPLNSSTTSILIIYFKIFINFPALLKVFRNL